jgi:hypothetical protein
MAKNGAPKRRRPAGCDNSAGGLGIEACVDAAPMFVTVWVDPSFSCRDEDTLFLCEDCAEALKEHAAHFDYDVIILDD